MMIKTQKVIKVGNSLAVTLDKKFVQLARVTAGMPLAVSYNPEKGLLSVAKSKNSIGALSDQEEVKAYISGKVTPELEAWTKRFLVKNQTAMKKLADL